MDRVDSASLPIPFCSVEGTHYEVGSQIGSTFRKQILKALQDSTFFNESILPHSQTPKGSALYSLYLATATARYPEYIEELRGIADGAQTPFSKIFLWNVTTEWKQLLEPGNIDALLLACSTIYFTNDSDNVAVFGHNEDGVPDDLGTSYLVHARIREKTGEIDEFLSFCRGADLCGRASGFNTRTGIVLSSNVLFPKNIDTTAVPISFLNRAALSSSLDGIRKALQEVPSSAGTSLNVGDLNSMKISNFEVAPYTGAVETEIGDTNTTSSFYHFNMYLHCGSAEQYDHTSSLHRLARVKTLPPPTGPPDILRLLGDTKDQQYPVYRTATPPDPMCTLATCLFDMPEKKYYLYHGNPVDAQPVLVLPMVTGLN